MRKGFGLAILAVVLASSAPAQHGKVEESRFYNFPYKGDTWTGEIASLGQADATLTLSYTGKNGQTQTFTGRFTSRVKAYVKGHPEQKVTRLNVGDRIIAYYIAPGQKYFILDEQAKKKDAVATENIVFEVAVFPKK
jgi:hypothetical protein